MAGQLIQYIVVRADLLKTLNWPVGAVIAQACHACCAVTYLFHNDPHTQEYLKDLNNMHKVVLEASIDELNICNTRYLVIMALFGNRYVFLCNSRHL
jgi:peptidyl-tRNA hydrolase